jgi:hypothetical protein
MPWKSQAQAAWSHSPAGEKALGGKAKVAEWDRSAQGMRLPKRRKPAARIKRSKKT